MNYCIARATIALFFHGRVIIHPLHVSPVKTIGDFAFTVRLARQSKFRGHNFAFCFQKALLALINDLLEGLLPQFLVIHNIQFVGGVVGQAQHPLHLHMG